MAAVPGVLLDHVQEQLAQRDRVVAAVRIDLAEVGVLLDERLGEGDLPLPVGERLRDDRLVGDRAAERLSGSASDQ